MDGGEGGGGVTLTVFQHSDHAAAWLHSGQDQSCLTRINTRQ